MRFSGWREGWTNPFFAFFPAARWQMFTEEGSLCADVVEKINIAEMVPISEKSQNLQKHEEKTVFVVMDVEANHT